jgi:hypothetical protein
MNLTKLISPFLDLYIIRYGIYQFTQKLNWKMLQKKEKADCDQYGPAACRGPREA